MNAQADTSCPVKRPYRSRAINQMPPDLFERFYSLLKVTAYGNYADAERWTKEMGYPVKAAIIQRFVDELLGAETAPCLQALTQQFQSRLTNEERIKLSHRLEFMACQMNTMREYMGEQEGKS